MTEVQRIIPVHIRVLKVWPADEDEPPDAAFEDRGGFYIAPDHGLGIRLFMRRPLDMAIHDLVFEAVRTAVNIVAVQGWAPMQMLNEVVVDPDAPSIRTTFVVELNMVTGEIRIRE